MQIRNTQALLVAAILLVSSCSAAPAREHGGAGKPAAMTAGGSQTGAPAIARRGDYATASDGARIYYEVCGSGPALVLVHGLGGNHAVWFHQVAHFAKDHTVVTLSQRGFAPSGGDQSHYDVALLVRDLEAVMDAAKVERAVVVGQSMGGWTALGAALRVPERVSALILADTLGGIHDETIATHMREVTATAVRLGDTPPPLGVHPALSEGFSQRRPDLGYLYQTLTTFGAPSPGSISKQLGEARVSPETLKGQRVPTLFVVGVEDRLFPPALVRRAASYIDNAKVIEIEAAGHSPYFENPAAWNAAVSDFLNRGQTPF